MGSVMDTCLLISRSAAAGRWCARRVARSVSQGGRDSEAGHGGAVKAGRSANPGAGQGQDR